jgi:hypothetical protein
MCLALWPALRPGPSFDPWDAGESFTLPPKIRQYSGVRLRRLSVHRGFSGWISPEGGFGSGLAEEIDS